MKIEIRKAISDDARDIADVQCKSWLTTYPGIIPDEIIEKFTQMSDKKVQLFRESILNNMIVVTINRKVVGYVRYGKSNFKNEEVGEVQALYILKEYQKNGIGKKLVNCAVNEFVNQGLNSMIISVAKGNSAIEFYKKIGGVVVDEKYNERFKCYEYTLYYDKLKEKFKNGKLELCKG